MSTLTARQTFFADGRKVTKGDKVESTDPITNGRSELFVADESPVEQATAAPGEKRSTPRKRAAKPKE